MKNGLVSICALVALSGVASADVISAKYDIPWNPGANTHFQMRSPSNGADPAFRDDTAVVINGARQDLPAGAGVNSDIPAQYPTYCVEVDENVQVSVGGAFNAGTYTHEVLPLLGSTTQAGGLSGPVTFDALRTYRMERLWGQFYGVLNQTDATYSGAFQLAQWEIAFESAPALDLFDGASRFSVTDGATALNVLAQQMLSVLDNAGPQTGLYLLRNNGVQDLVTPVPAPSAIGMIAVAGLAAGRRRR
jgi:hypothetical protein